MNDMTNSAWIHNFTVNNEKIMNAYNEYETRNKRKRNKKIEKMVAKITSMTPLLKRRCQL